MASFFCNFLEVFDCFVTILMPLSNPYGTKTQIFFVLHAYIDPIASLVQRNGPLDDFWFLRRSHIDGYRIVSSLSNFKIYQKKFRELGCEQELVCGGCPGLDKSIGEYEKAVAYGGGADILIAINNKENIEIIQNLLKQIERDENYFLDFKIIFRPYPGYKNDKDFLKLKDMFQDKPWFVYDESEKLEAETMKGCCVLIGDYSSLVWTFPLTTLKPSILLFKDKAILENSYGDVRFFNPLLHFSASNVEEVLQAIEQSKQNCKQRADEIFQYREREVFNLGNSSKFIADFIIQKLKGE